MSAAALDLMELGLEAAQDNESVQELQERFDQLQLETQQLREQLGEQVQRTERAEQRTQMLEQAVGTWQGRAQQVVGVCAKPCGSRLTGADVLVSGSCPKCRRSVATALAGTADSGLDQKELLFVLGAAGLLLGLLAATGGK
jgi:regulator of replication initiation timing